MDDANSVTFVLEDEDHTLANSICYFLNKVHLCVRRNTRACNHVVVACA